MFPQRDFSELQELDVRPGFDGVEIFWSGYKGDCKEVVIRLPRCEFGMMTAPGDIKLSFEFKGDLGTAVIGGKEKRVVAIRITRARETGIVYFSLYVDTGKPRAMEIKRRMLSRHAQEAWAMVV